MDKCGIFTISIDVELAWGLCYKPIRENTRQAILSEREIIKQLLSLFSRYEIQATWAIVGHLLYDNCSWENRIAHPEINRPITKNFKYDWFFQHPKSRQDPLWYGPDIIECIRNASPEQEIASHSFSHFPYDEKNTDYDAVVKDIEWIKHTHELFNLPFEIFIFPRNIVGYKEPLAKAGVLAYRGRTPRWFHCLPYRSFRHLANIFSFVIGATPPTVKSNIDETRMVNIPDSMQLLGRYGAWRLVPSKKLISMGIAGLDNAVKNKQIFHLWFHPLSFTYETESQFHVLESIIKHAQSLRENGKLEVLTMGRIQKRTIVDQALTLQAKRIEKNSNAIVYHDKTAHDFDKKYQDLSKNYYSSSFKYGRKKIELLLNDTLNVLTKNAYILDVGCGTGEHLRYCRQKGFHNLMGLEPSAEMQQIAINRDPEIPIVDGTSNHLPFRDATFDFIMAIEVLRYFKHSDIQTAYREILRVLKPGGRVFFTLVNRYALNGFYLYDKTRRFILPLFNHKDSLHCEFVTPHQVKKELNKIGFQNVVFYGRVFAPLHIAYKINTGFTAKMAQYLEQFFDRISNKNWMVPFAGHLIVIAKRP